MINKPPLTGQTAFDVWAQSVQFVFNNYIQSLVVPVSALGTGSAMLHGKHVTFQLQATETAYFEFIVPHSIREFKEVTIRFIPSTTGSINYTVNLSYGGVGEDENASTKTVSATSVSVTDDKIMEIDITSLFTDQEAGDQIGCELILDAVTTTTDVHVLSLYIKYI